MPAEKLKGAFVQAEIQAKGVNQAYQSTKRMPTPGKARSKAAKMKRRY